MNLTVVELKPALTGIKPAWQALSQVSHRAALVLRFFSPENLDKAFLACWSGKHGRVPETASCPPFAERHRQFFGLTSCASQSAPDVRRCVAASRFGPTWPNVLSEFNAMSTFDALKARLRSELVSKSAQREVNRILAVSQAESDRLTGPVLSLEVGAHG